MLPLLCLRAPQTQIGQWQSACEWGSMGAADAVPSFTHPHVVLYPI